MVRALIFDFDGLIVDSEMPIYLAWKKQYASFGLELPLMDWVEVIGGHELNRFKIRLENQTGLQLDWELLDKQRIAWHGQEMDKQRLLPGVFEIMKAGGERGWKIGVASSSGRDWVEQGLERYKLRGMVDVVATRDHSGTVKPHPGVYLYALEKMKAAADRSIAFEDSAKGVESAKAAGLTVVAVPNQLTRLQDLSQADLLLESLAQWEFKC